MRVFQILAVAGAVALLAGGCVSSKRAMRVSPLAKEVEVSFDQEAVNLWPFYFNAGGSGAILWPLADFDAQGFAVRPFYVQDGRERSVLFPLSAWNDRSGWALNGYWTERNFGMWPLFHHGPGGGYCLLGWRSPESWGVFPLARFGARGGYAGPVWWKSGENGARAYGVFPVWCHTPDFRMAGLFYRTLYGGNTESWGVFPLLHSSEEWNHIGPAWWKPENGSWGVFPLAWITPDFSLAGPVWWKPDNNSWGVFPLAWIVQDFGIAGPVWWDGDNSSWGIFPLLWLKPELSVAGPVWWESEAGKVKGGGLFPVLWLLRDFSLAGPVYWNRENGSTVSWGIFPLMFTSPQWGYCGPAWWSRDERGVDGWGAFPLLWVKRNFGLAGPVWWSSDRDGMKSGGVFPLAWLSRSFNLAGPVWWKPENGSWGVFPLAWLSRSFNLAGPVYWNRENGETVSGGLFPLAHLSKEWNYAGPVIWRYGDDRRSRAFGVLPLCWRYQDFRLVGPVWWEKSDWGVLPLFWKVGDENMLFPFYYYWHNGENFKFNLLGPVGGVKRRSSRPEWDWHFLWPLLEKDGDSFGVWPLFSDNRRFGGGVLPSPLFSRREERRSSNGYTLPEKVYRYGGGSEAELDSVKYTVGMLLGSRSTARVQVWKDEADRETLEKLPVLLREQPDGKKDAGAYETWKREVAALLEKLRLEGPVPEDWKAQQALFQEMARRFCTEQERVEGKALLGLLWDYSRQDGEFESRWLLGLIARDRGSENIRDLNVLGGLYRERSRDGLTEYSIFPFISRLEGPGRSRWSFCAGMFRHETDGGRSGGAVFFIPYGDL